MLSSGGTADWSSENLPKDKYEEVITFFREDAKGIQFSYNDAVVVSLNIKNYNVHRILVDDESSVDVLFHNAFSKMDIPSGQLGRLDSPL